MKIRPLEDRVVVKSLEAEEKTAGGIIIPDTAKEKPQEGKVIAVGRGRTLENGEHKSSELKEGYRVIYRKYSGMEIKNDQGENLLIMKEDDILAIFTKD